MSDPDKTPTLAAQITPHGIGGIAVVHLAGPDAAQNLARCFANKNKAACAPPTPGEIRYGFIVARDGAILDEVLVAATSAGRYEINCHGGTATVRGVLALLRENGAEIVGPVRMLEEHGSLRGKNAIEREAYESMLGAKSLLAAQHLAAQSEGALSRTLRAVIGDIEAKNYAAAQAKTQRLLETAPFGIALARPPRVVIAGKPNAGKSSLLNAILSYERAIVSETPGTTRDILSGITLIDGIAFDFHDTAGLRRSDLHPEIQGVRRAEAAMAEADCLVYALDGSLAADQTEITALAQMAQNRRVLACLNKSDLGTNAQTAVRLEEILPEAEIRPTSCVSGTGIEELRQAIAAKCIPTRDAAPGEALLFNEKQLSVLLGARDGLLADRPAEDLPAALRGLLESERNS